MQEFIEQLTGNEKWGPPPASRTIDVMLIVKIRGSHSTSDSQCPVCSDRDNNSNSSSKRNNSGHNRGKSLLSSLWLFCSSNQGSGAGEVSLELPAMTIMDHRYRYSHSALHLCLQDKMRTSVGKAYPNSYIEHGTAVPQSAGASLRHDKATRFKPV